MQRNSQMQLAAKAWAKYNKKWSGKSNYKKICFSVTYLGKVTSVSKNILNIFFKQGVEVIFRNKNWQVQQKFGSNFETEKDGWWRSRSWNRSRRWNWNEGLKNLGRKSFGSALDRSSDGNRMETKCLGLKDRWSERRKHKHKQKHRSAYNERDRNREKVRNREREREKERNRDTYRQTERGEKLSSFCFCLIYQRVETISFPVHFSPFLIGFIKGERRGRKNCIFPQ